MRGSGASRWTWLSAELGLTLAAAALIATTLGIDYLNSPNWPTGGDTSSHILYAWLYADSLLFSGHVLPWMPEVFAGFPFLSYYFPLPFIVIALLSKVLGFSPAFKWGVFLAQMLLPGSVFAASRRWLGYSWQASLLAAMGTLAFLLHEQNSIWGGNLLSTLAGEFSYSYGSAFAALSMMAWLRAVHSGRGWVLAALLEAATGYSHGFPLLLVGFSTGFLLLEGPSFKRSLRLLLRGHLLAFCLLGGWLWPMLEMHGLTTPNDSAYEVAAWQELLPLPLIPVLAGGLLALASQLLVRLRVAWTPLQVSAIRYFASGAGLAALAFLTGDRLGLADVRFFPLVWLCGAIACGWLAGTVLAAAGGTSREAQHRPWRQRLGRALLAAAAALGLLAFYAGKCGRHPTGGCGTTPASMRNRSGSI